MFIVGISQLIAIQGDLCVRGYWKTPDNMSKDEVLDWFKEQFENIGLSDVKETLYFPRTTGNIKKISRSSRFINQGLLIPKRNIKNIESLLFFFP